MKICIPIEMENGLSSPRCAHFGSAPAFMVVDVKSMDCRTIVNNNQHHDHGSCLPVQLFDGKSIGGVVVSGIGRGALNRFATANIQVYFSNLATVGEVVLAFNAGTLERMESRNACAGHAHS